jgi:hypothetical protein
MISTTVKRRPDAVSGAMSPNPTVETVITVM